MKEKIQHWAINKKLHTANPDKQVIKLMEEVGELASSYLKMKPDALMDAIGDIQVVLIILCMQLHLSPESCLERAYEQIKDRKGTLRRGTFIKAEDL